MKEKIISDKFKKFLIRLFNTGYGIGHNNTVEGCFTDIHCDDFDSFHSDIVDQILDESQEDELQAPFNYPQIFFTVKWICDNINTDKIDGDDLSEIKKLADACHIAYLKDT